MRATITYHGGKTYWTGKTRFKLGIPLQVTDPKIVKHCQMTAGFSVTLDEAGADEAPKKIVRPVAAPSAEPLKKMLKKVRRA